MVLSPRGNREVNYVAEKGKARTRGTDAQFLLREFKHTQSKNETNEVTDLL
jgi:hypothetical protein